MKKWIRFITFCLIALMLFEWLNLSTSNANQGWRDFYKLPHNNVDVVFMGNSHNFETFQPQVIDDLIPINSFVLGTSGENVVVSYYELQELLKYQKPKVVVLETFALDMSDLLVPELMYEYLDVSPLNINHISLWLNYFQPKEIFNLFPALRLRVDWNSPRKFFGQLSTVFREREARIDPKRGYIANTGVLLPEEYESALRQPMRESGYSLDNNEQYLNKFLELCLENNIQLILSVVPSINISGGQFEYYVPFDYAAYAQKNGLEVIQMDMTGFKTFDYSDPTHVNSIGSLQTSIQMAHSLAGRMSLEVDRSKQAYYESYNITDYEWEINGTKGSFTLIPAEKTAPLEYRFTLREMSTKEELSTSGWQRGNSYVFDFSNVKSEYIEVTIWNTDGDYKIILNFRFPSTNNSK